MGSPPHFLDRLLEGADARHALQNRRTGLLLARHLETAFDSRSRRRGLLGRDGLSPETALIIAPCNSVHTFFMRFPIDVAFVNRSGTVLNLYRGLKPWRIGLSLAGFAAIELASGATRPSGTVVGDQLDLIVLR